MPTAGEKSSSGAGCSWLLLLSYHRGIDLEDLDQPGLAGLPGFLERLSQGCWLLPIDSGTALRFCHRRIAPLRRITTIDHVEMPLSFFMESWIDFDIEQNYSGH
jgi:hypothetical protein